MPDIVFDSLSITLLTVFLQNNPDAFSNIVPKREEEDVFDNFWMFWIELNESTVNDRLQPYCEKYESEDFIQLKSDVLQVYKKLLKQYASLDESNSFKHDVLDSCNYYMDKYSENFNRYGEKRTFVKKSILTKGNYDPNRVENSFKSITFILPVIMDHITSGDSIEHLSRIQIKSNPISAVGFEL
tara:strand:- start:123 stop:677 length:555 start_codon:yes stop_codon:yes gene_type:complete